MAYSEINQKIKVVSVSEFTKIVNETIFGVETVWVEGEASNFKNWLDRWIFFSVKDEFAVLNCNISKYKLESFGFSLEDGMKIRVLGRPELRNKGEFTLNVQELQLCGEGAFKKAYELLKKKLELEGFFARKRKIPDFVENIGLITSKSGVVIHDFLKNLKPFGFKVYFCDARVEGKNAAFSLGEAIKWFNKNRPDLDVLVVARGGGSLEELQPFNNETLAKAIFASDIPVISGIGHEVDVPIASLVADVSVSTPTAAAMYLNSSWEALEKKLPYSKEKLAVHFNDYLEFCFDKTKTLAGNILDIFEGLIKEKMDLILNSEKYLTAVSPERSLKLGYSIVLNQENKVIKNINQIKINEILTTRLHQGEFSSEVKETKTDIKYGGQ